MFKDVLNEDERCAGIPAHPFSKWVCEWSPSNKIKTCRKSCFDSFELTSGSKKLKCHVKNGWIQKDIAACIPVPAPNCDELNNDIVPESIHFKIEICSKYDTTTRIIFSSLSFSFFVAKINKRNFTDEWTLIINFDRDLDFFNFNIENGSLALKKERFVY